MDVFARTDVRRDGMDSIKKGGAPEDLQKNQSDEVQKLTDEAIKKVDAMLLEKEKDIMKV